MGRLFAVIQRDLLQLTRDRAGLLVLFVMPLALVLIMSLVQDSVLKATGEASVELLLVDNDRSDLSRTLEAQLEASGAVRLVREVKGQPVDAARARAEVAAGHYPFALVIPKGLGQDLTAAATVMARQTLSGTADTQRPALPAPQLLVDPGVQQMFRIGVSSALERILQGLEFRARGRALAAQLKQRLQPAAASSGPLLFPAAPADEPAAEMPAPLLGLQQEVAVTGRFLQKPNAAQHNVPAWTLFGMFFIVVPLSGLVLRERQNGTAQRLLTLPVSPLTVLTGRVFAFLGVGLGQFFGMLAVGLWVLPALGAPALVVGSQWPLLLLLAVAATLAATSYGLLLGTVAGSYEQASMFGAVSVVIAAALGGVMVPLYVMPKAMQAASVLSPLGWGLTAFQAVLVRGAGLRAILPQLAALLAFFAACLLGAGFFSSRNRNRPG